MTTDQKTNGVAGSTQEAIKVRYTAKTHTSGGRRGGVSRSDDGRLEVKFSAPGVPGTGTNPEQLFAAGWSACFISAMGLVANKMKVKLPADAAIDAEIDLCNSGDVYSSGHVLTSACRAWSAKSLRPLSTPRTARLVHIRTLRAATSTSLSTFCRPNLAQAVLQELCRLSRTLVAARG
jgi:Ohr subfamily peroxiredoxin